MSALDIYLDGLATDFPQLKSVAENVKILEKSAQERQLKIMMGALHEDEHSTIYITHKDQMWHLITVVKAGEELVHEVLCRHEDFAEFINLVNEYSDYVEGE